MTTPRKRAKLPAIVISEDDFEALDRLIGDQPVAGAAVLLREELDRADVREPSRMPRNAVGLNRWIHYADDRGGDTRRVQLVLPKDADIDAGKVSILSHVGAGLIGLKEGQVIDWPDPSGVSRRLTLVMIEDEDPIEAVPR